MIDKEIKSYFIIYMNKSEALNYFILNLTGCIKMKKSSWTLKYIFLK